MRPLDLAQSLTSRNWASVGTEAVGRAVLDQLRALDPVSYLRFASVYKGFEDVTDFEREVGLLQKTTSPKPKPGEPAA